jgi:hypothetical protein
MLNLLAILRSRIVDTYAALRRPREDPRLAIKHSWGKEVARERFSFQVSRYHDLVAGGRNVVDETTWQDLGMEEVFAKVDRTASFPGRQVLYHQLRTYEMDGAVLAERNREQAIFRSDPELREEVQLRLAGLDGPDAAWLAPLLLNNFPEKPQWAWLFHLCGVLPLASFVGMAMWPGLLIPGILLVVLNLVINETYGRKITPYFGGISQIHRLLRVAERLSALPDLHRLPQLTDLRETAPVCRQLRKRLGWLVSKREDMDQMVQALIGYINLILLVDIQIYLGSLTALRRHQAALVKMLEAVGTIDAAISVASFMDGLPVVSTPTLVEERRVDAVGLYHPLLLQPVGNQILCEGRSILITGSNMAGKTTFLRTVGINVILAQTLHLCLAERATIPRATVRSSIRREDRMAQGESYYAVELERVLGMIQDTERGDLRLFLLDEIFRGTNTLERVSAATAVLRHLSQRHLAMVTTHDLELQGLLADSYDMHHFSEHIVDGKHGFNYLIQPGPTTGRNAIRLLELRGYPESITREAREMADRLTS